MIKLIKRLIAKYKQRKSERESRNTNEALRIISDRYNGKTIDNKKTYTIIPALPFTLRF